MAYYNTLSDLPDRVKSALIDEIGEEEEIEGGVPQSGEGFFSKYSKYYLLTTDRFLSFQKGPLGGVKSDSIYLENISRVRFTSSGVRVELEIHGSGFDEEYTIQDPSRSGDPDEFATTLQKESARV